jgi:hypothetical protein
MTELNADIASIIRRSCGHRNDLYQRQVNDKRLTQRVSGADSVALVVGWAISLNGGPSRVASVFRPSENDCRQRRDRVTYVANAEPVTEEVVKGKPQLLARLHQTVHDIARNTAILATNSVCAGLIVPPEIFRFVTNVRRSFSDALVCNGISGCSSTFSSSFFRRCSRSSNLSRTS